MRCRYVVIQLIEQPYPELEPGGTHRLIAFRESFFDDAHEAGAVLRWNGALVRLVGSAGERIEQI